MDFFVIMLCWVAAIALLILFAVKNGKKNKSINRILVCGPKDKYTYIVQKKGIFFWKTQKCVVQSVLIDAHFDNIDSVNKFIDEQTKSKK